MEQKCEVWGCKVKGEQERLKPGSGTQEELQAQLTKAL
jgi:hypothetical protein